MRRYELGMSLDYVSNWSIADAVREIFQNSLDEEIENPDNKWYFNYNKEDGILKIGNKLSRLSTKSLLLGSSSKRDNEFTIGQHGEGYKVATIVLLRNGCSVKVYNYNEKEVWTAKVIKSRRYEAEIGVFDVEKLGVFKTIPEHNLIFEISNITEDTYNSIKETNLWLQGDLGKIIESPNCGRVLLDEKYKGMIFVKGLYVCKKDQLAYGYDLEPKLVKLDRDRGLVDSYDLQRQLGNVLANTMDSEFIKKVKDTWDGEYIRWYTSYQKEKFEDVYNSSYDEFKRKYGKDAYPCCDTEDFNRLKRRGYNAVMLTFNQQHYITNSRKFILNDRLKEEDTSLSEELLSWFEKTKEFLPEELVKEGENLIKDITSVLG